MGSTIAKRGMRQGKRKEKWGTNLGGVAGGYRVGGD